MDAVTVETETCEATEHQEQDGACAVCGTPLVRVKLRIENSYELYDDVTTEWEGWVEEPGEDPHDGEWDYENLYPHTGVGHEDGDSWYDIEILESTDPTLVNRKFEFGY